MKLYHFAPKHMLDDIKRTGLRKGTFPIIRTIGPIELIGPCQWLTSDPVFENQTWATTQELIKYDRNEVRLTISIPKTSRNYLIKAIDFIQRLPKDAHHIVTKWPGGHNWYIYLGNIPSGWIRDIEYKNKIT